MPQDPVVEGYILAAHERPRTRMGGGPAAGSGGFGTRPFILPAGPDAGAGWLAWTVVRPARRLPAFHPSLPASGRV